MTTQTKLTADSESLDWAAIVTDLDKEGYAILPAYISDEQASQLTAIADGDHLAGSPVSLQDLELGRGEVWKTHSTKLELPLEWMQVLFDRLRPVAARWNETMSAGSPDVAATEAGPLKSKSSKPAARAKAQIEVTRLREGGYQALHQTEAAAEAFPLQLVALLSDPDSDFSGGQFVMTEQRPRMQSRPMVLPLRKGDVAIISTANRPFKGSKGFYRVNMKHAISRVRGGERIGLEVVFEAPSRTSNG